MKPLGHGLINFQLGPHVQKCREPRNFMMDELQVDHD